MLEYSRAPLDSGWNVGGGQGGGGGVGGDASVALIPARLLEQKSPLAHVCRGVVLRVEEQDDRRGRAELVLRARQRFGLILRRRILCSSPCCLAAGAVVFHAMGDASLLFPSARSYVPTQDVPPVQECVHQIRLADCEAEPIVQDGGGGCGRDGEGGG